VPHETLQRALDELAAAESAVLDTSPTGTRLALAEVSRAVEELGWSLAVVIPFVLLLGFLFLQQVFGRIIVATIRVPSHTAS
jgi:sirohydrochlorin ferrochelatase